MLNTIRLFDQTHKSPSRLREYLRVLVRHLSSLNMSFASLCRPASARASSSTLTGQAIRHDIRLSLSESSRRSYATARTTTKARPKAETKPKKEEEDFSVQSLDGKIADGQRQAQDLKRLDIDWLSMSRKVIRKCSVCRPSTIYGMDQKIWMLRSVERCASSETPKRWVVPALTSQCKDATHHFPYPVWVAQKAVNRLEGD